MVSFWGTVVVVVVVGDAAAADDDVVEFAAEMRWRGRTKRRGMRRRNGWSKDRHLYFDRRHLPRSFP